MTKHGTPLMFFYGHCVGEKQAFQSPFPTFKTRRVPFNWIFMAVSTQETAGKPKFDCFVLFWGRKLSKFQCQCQWFQMVQIILRWFWWLGGGFKYYIIFTHFLGKWSNLTCTSVSEERLVQHGSTTNQMTVFNISLVCTQLYVGPPCSLASRGPHSPFERQTKLPSQAWLGYLYVTHVPTKRCTKIQPYQQRSPCFSQPHWLNKQSSWGVFGRLPIGDLQHYLFF